MRIVIVGQQAFGKAVLEAFIARGDEVAGVFAAPERPGARPDPLVVAAQERGVTVHRFAKYSSEEAQRALADLKADLGVIAGDFEGTGFWGTLKQYAIRSYYWEQNDFVVNTRSMSGGMERAGAPRVALTARTTRKHSSTALVISFWKFALKRIPR